MSATFADCVMLKTYPFLSINNVGKLTNRQYNVMLEHAFSMAAFFAGSENAKLKTDEEQQFEIDYEYNLMKLKK